MKILTEKYPMGSIKGQRSDGRYIDGYLYDNLKVLAKAIVNDMTFMAVLYSSTLEVGTGKSVLATQIGEAWSYIMKEEHNIDVPFELNNVVWRPQQLIERAFQVPKYSCILLDEWEDANYWSALGMSLRQFFRKCRQLNLFMIVIIPNWFQMPLSYAVSRSIFAIDVRFEKGFSRGYFCFYGFESKRKLYIDGKKFHNYYCARPDFSGRFTDGYGVPDKEYRATKLTDMMEYDKDEKKPLTEREVKIKLAQKMRKTFKMSTEMIGKFFDVSRKSIEKWCTIDTELFGKPNWTLQNPILTNKEVVWDEEGMEDVVPKKDDVVPNNNDKEPTERTEAVQDKEELSLE